MDEKTSHALELSIVKWKSIASFGGEDRADRNCELCKVFAVGTNNCRGCPVRDEVIERTGHDHMEASCGQTPFGKWTKHHRTEHSHSIPRKVLCEGCSSIAFDEVRYLCGLRAKKKDKLDLWPDDLMVSPACPRPYKHSKRPHMSPLRARMLNDIGHAISTHENNHGHPTEENVDNRVQKAMKVHRRRLHTDPDHPITTSQVEAIAQRVMSLAFNTHRLDHHPDEKFSSAPLARAGHIWCDDEDGALDCALVEFIKRRASKHQRTESAIASRISQKDLLAKHI